MKMVITFRDGVVYLVYDRGIIRTYKTVARFAKDSILVAARNLGIFSERR